MIVDFTPQMTAAGPIPRRLFAYSGGFFTQQRLRRILELSGHQICIGSPGPSDGIVVWGRGPTAWRGEAMARRTGNPLIRIEDAFLRSVLPGRMGDAALGLLIDPVGLHYDAASPSMIEQILNSDELDDPNLLSRSSDAIARLMHVDLSKYNHFDPKLPLPEPGYVLVIDQTRGDASLRASGADQATFRGMLSRALTDHPGARVIIKSHPETMYHLRQGHFGPQDARGNVSLLATAVSPLQLLLGATAVYTVSSQMGFEAILEGHAPHVFGTPFYAGWGVSHDENPLPNRTRRLTPERLFAAAMILAPTWYDPCRDRLCSFEDAIDQLEAETRAYREDRDGHVAFGMRAWKRRHLQSFYGGQKPLRFASTAERAVAMAETLGRNLLIWANKAPIMLTTTASVTRVEDGVLRSRGLGANLIAPLSLVTDDLGIYYDPGHPSRLEALVATPLQPWAHRRAARLIDTLVKDGVTKYNAGTQTLAMLPQGRRILVPGQVEDDASIVLGTIGIRTNMALLRATRDANPDAILIYKPHPDVEAGLRPGAITADDIAGLADVTLRQTDPAAIIAQCDEVWTMTSTLGFEALLRGKAVTCLGMPFYAGWGLTMDLAPVPNRRTALASAHGPVTLTRLTHAVLIAYPRYFDPVTHRACPPEVAIERLSLGPIPRPGPIHRGVAKLQGRFAGFAHLWR